MRQQAAIAFVALVVGACNSADVTSPSSDELRPQLLTAATGITISGDLTPYRLYPPKYRYLGTSLPSGTISNYLGSLQYIDGYYYTVDPAFEIAKYKTLYYLLPRAAKFGLDKYGYFCGAGWGYSTTKYPNNNSIAPLPDGGLDRACRSHDMAWDIGTASAVRNGDYAFLNTLKSISPARWGYEADYIPKAVKWMQCRVTNGVSVATGVESKCGFLVVTIVGSSVLHSTIVRF